MNVLECTDITKNFGMLSALSKVTFSLGEGEILGIIGPNGAGKTTLFNCMIGVYRPDGGRVLFYGKDITGMRPHKICRLGLAKTSQMMEPFRAMTVFENVMVGALYGGQMNMSEARRMTQEIVDFAGLADQQSKASASLSVPGRRRLELARALATKAKVLLLDENMAGLNPHELDEALELIRKIRQSGKAIIVVEHVMRAVMEISDRIMVLNYGEKITEGSPAEIVRDARVIEAYFGPSAHSLSTT